MLYTTIVERNLSEKMPVLTDETGDYTYRELHRRALNTLEYFCRRGAKIGDRILIINRNDCRTVTAILACLAGGLIFILVPEDCRRNELADIIQDATPSVILDPQEAEIAQMCLVSARAKVSKDAGAYILYTSGSTGAKRGVFARHKQIYFCCQSILARLNYRYSDRVLCAIPLEFDYGLYQIFLSLWSKARLFLGKPRVIQMIPRYLHQWNITIYPAIPSVINLLLKLRLIERVPLPMLRCVTFTGEYLPPELVMELQELLPYTEVIPMYGTTECKRIAIMPPQRLDKTLAGSCGLPLEGVTVYLKKSCSQDVVGELIVEGSNVMEGYWSGTDDGFGVNTATGMRTYATGDLMSIDPDGFLYFHGRCNGLIKCRGLRISELEVEIAVRQARGVLECAVLGIPDRVFGEKIGICAYVRNQQAEEQIWKVLKEKTNYQNVCELRLFSMPLPKGSNGKIDKQRLRNEFNEK